MARLTIARPGRRRCNSSTSIEAARVPPTVTAAAAGLGPEPLVRLGEPAAAGGPGPVRSNPA